MQYSVQTFCYASVNCDTAAADDQVRTLVRPNLPVVLYNFGYVG